MKLQEFQGKEILRKKGISLPESLLAHFPNEAWMHSMTIGFPCMLKTQILTGGRGKAGGVMKCENAEQVRVTAEKMFRKSFTTKQSGSHSLVVRKLLVEKCVRIEKEFYFSIVMDSESREPLIIASKEGGMEIEEISRSNPRKILRIPVNPYTGLQSFHVRELLAFLDLNLENHSFYDFFKTIYRVFIEKECLMLEINPLVLDKGGQLIPVDVKMDIDDNALFRQRDILKLRDLTELGSSEIEAKLSGLNFIKLEGNVGCMVNGAGLAMATMDFIKMAGAEPANFLDVGGVATPETISKGFEIILKDKSIKAVFINIFGGIVRCDKVADGIVSAVKNLKIKVPVIIRLSGSNLESGLKILNNSSFEFNAVETVEEASLILKKVIAGNKKEEKTCQ